MLMWIFPFILLGYSNKLENWEFDKEVPSILQIRRAAVFIDTERGIEEKAVEKPRQSQTNSPIGLNKHPLNFFSISHSTEQETVEDEDEEEEDICYIPVLDREDEEV